jgi:phosphate transport system substrate-binding protein
VVIIVNLENPAAPLDLTTEQVAVIFAKDITNWSELGGKDEDIVVVSREEGSGTREFFEEEIGDISADILCESNDEVKDTVAGEPAAIGYVSSGYIEEDESAVSPVRINGVEPTMENYLCGDYPLLRSLYFLHRPPEPSPNKLIRAFMEFCLGDEGQSIIEEEGYIPIS